ncbi:helix-turn-helix domain-containing protein [Paenibacillus phytohabitans]|uniref:helix-turn-helix domain-containing protein n=1 Tax=Paenibacillus phytohabitans TaxID=2654978 RepID=UPI001492F30A
MLSRRMIPGSFFKKSLILNLLIASIPGLIVGVLIYWFVGGQLESELLTMHENQITKRAEQISDQFERFEIMMSHFAFEPVFNNNLSETDFLRQFEITRDITQTVIIMKNSLPIQTEVELYVNTTSPVWFSPQYETIALGSKRGQQMKALLSKGGSSAHWMLLPSAAEGDDSSELAFVHKVPSDVSNPYAVLVARVDHTDLQKLLDSLTPYSGSAAFLLNEDNKQLYSADSQHASLLIQNLILELNQYSGETAKFIWSWEGRKYVVSFGKQQRVGTEWKYVSAVPIDEIISPLVFLSKLILIISCSGLLLATILAWLASRRIYSPLADFMKRLSYDMRISEISSQDEFRVIGQEWLRLMTQSMALQSTLEQQLPQVRQGFLYQLIQGYLSSYEEEELKERMRQHGWRVDGCVYHVLFVRVTGLIQANMSGRFELGDEGLVSFTVANIIQELAEERRISCQVLNFHDLTAGIIVEMVPADAEDHKNIVYEFSEILVETVHQILKMRVTVSLGESSPDIRRIPWLFEEARQILGNRTWEVNYQVLDVELFKVREKVDGTAYPLFIERELMQALRIGTLDEAELLLHDFLEALTSNGATDLDVKQGVVNLLSSIEHEIMHLGLNPNDVLTSVNRFEQLSAIRESEHISKWFMEKIISPFISELEARNDEKLKAIVGKAVQYIEVKYMENFSLEDCALFCGTNATLLSRSFRKVSGKNFIDYLTELRMEKAKAMLRDTELMVYHIAEKVGYQHNYFNRLFKKQEGVTPKQYRSRIRGG